MTRVAKTKTGSHDFYVGSTKVGSIGGAAGDSMQQIVQDNNADKPSYYAAAGTEYVNTPANAALNIGASPCTLLLSFKTDTASVGSAKPLIYVWTGSSSGVWLYYSTAGKFQLSQGDGTIVSTTSTGSVPVGMWTSVAAVRDATPSQRIYIDGILDTSDTQVNKTLTNANGLFQVGESSGLPLTNYARALFFNYALSADQVRRYSNGAKLDFVDIGGSMVNTATNGGYSDTTDWTNPTSGLAQYWTALNLNGKSIVTGNGFTGNAQRAAYSSTSSDVIIYPPGSYTLGKRYQITFKYRSNQTLKIACNTFGSPLATFTANAGNAISASCVVTMDATGNIGFGWSGAVASDYMEIDEVRIIQLGAIVDWEPESAIPSVWHDESGNQLDGAVTDALINLPHFANTDYGRAAVIQELVDSSVGANYQFPVATNIISLPLSTQLMPGTGDASVITTCRTSHSTADQIVHVISADGSNTLALVRKVNDTLQFQYGGVSNLLTTSAISDKVVTAALTRSSSGMQTYLNGIKDSSTAVSGTVVGTAAVASLGYTTTGMVGGNIYRHLQFNYALTEDKIRRYSAGAKLDYEDVGGSMTPIYGPQAFTGTLDSWTAYGSGVSLANTGGTVMTISGMRTSVTDSGVYRALTLPANAGKRLRAVVTLSCSSGTRQISLGGIGTPNSARAKLHPITITTTPTIYYYDFDVAYSGSEVDFLPQDDLTADVIVDNLSFIPLGAVLDLEPEGIYGNNWMDSSGNNLHGAASGAVATNVLNYYTPTISSQQALNGGSGYASGATVNCGSLVLTPGRWLVTASIGTIFSNHNPTVTKIIASISTTSATHDSLTFVMNMNIDSTNGCPVISAPQKIFTVAAGTTQTIYFVGTITSSAVWDGFCSYSVVKV